MRLGCAVQMAARPTPSKPAPAPRWPARRSCTARSAARDWGC